MTFEKGSIIVQVRPLLIGLPIVLAATGLSAAPAFAQDDGTAPAAPAGPADPDANRTSVTVGVGGVYMPDYEGSNDYRFSAAPVAIGSIEGYNFQVVGNRASVDLIANKPGPGWDIQLGPVAVWDFNRSTISQIDDTRVRALGKRGSSIETGGYFGIGRVGVITSDYDRLSVTVSYRVGVTGAQRGGVFTPTISYFTPLSRKAAVGLFGSAERAERKYAAAYYSVSAAGSTASGLPQFDAHGGWKNWTVGGFATVALTGDLLHGFKLMAGGTYRRLMNDFADSPVVSIAGSKGQWMGGAGLAYTF